MAAIQGRQRIGDKQLGVLFDGGKVRRRREWRGVKDTAYAFARWLQTWGKMAGLIGRDPVRMIRAFWKYRWLSAYLATPMMVGPRYIVFFIRTCLPFCGERGLPTSCRPHRRSTASSVHPEVPMQSRPHRH